MAIPSYSLAPVFGISISEQRKIYFNHRNTLISLLSNTLIFWSAVIFMLITAAITLVQEMRASKRRAAAAV
ncbi:hypothetical protein [Symbiopectobacterium purcellii]|uniref:hypothetical protein n=1 Tax=Symbiopectobacterium purcellii TaxID=2871826 RepID=UPI003F83FE1C